MKAIVTSAALFLASFALTACIKEPEGPAQRIGRSIDELSRGMRDMSDEWAKDSEREREAREREYRERYKDRSDRDAYDYGREIPERDPYYDTPSNDYDSSTYDGPRERAPKDSYRQNGNRY